MIKEKLAASYDKKVLVTWTLTVLLFPIYYLVVRFFAPEYLLFMPFVLIASFIVIISIVLSLSKVHLVGRFYGLFLIIIVASTVLRLTEFISRGLHLEVSNTLSEDEWREITEEYKHQYSLLDFSDTLRQGSRAKWLDYKESSSIRDSLIAKTAFAKIDYLGTLFGCDSTFKICTGGSMVGYRDFEISLYDTIDIEENDTPINSHMKIFFHPGD